MTYNVFSGTLNPTHFTSLATWQNVFEFGVWDKIPEGSTLIFGDIRILLEHRSRV